ncbi:MAG: indole-3-glycerol phosphate synthase TrpC [Longimicrobiales bacterium]
MTTPIDGFLGLMAERSRSRVAAALRAAPYEQVHARALDRGPAEALRLSPDGFDLIAEVKLKSPSEGVLGESTAEGRTRVVNQVTTYSESGAAAISVLTEPTEFAGDLVHGAWATEATSTPVMRKDFLVDRYQVAEARAVGASGVLLIVRILDDETLRSMIALARELGMWVLLECFDEGDIDRAGVLSSPDVLLGVNCRNLDTLEVVFERLISLAPRLPMDAVTVAESGLCGPTAARTVVQAGYRMALVGSALMRAPTPGDLLASMLVAGREEASCVSA